MTTILRGYRALLSGKGKTPPPQRKSEKPQHTRVFRPHRARDRPVPGFTVRDKKTPQPTKEMPWYSLVGAFSLKKFGIPGSALFTDRRSGE